MRLRSMASSLLRWLGRVVGRHWHNGERIILHMLPNDRQVSSVVGVAKRDLVGRGSADDRIAQGVEQHLLNFLGGNAVFSNVLHIAVGIVVQVPNDVPRRHGKVSSVCL